MPGRRGNLLVTNGEKANAGADNESLGIGMAMQARPAARLRQEVEDDANIGTIGTALQFALPAVQMLGPVLTLDHMCH